MTTPRSRIPRTPREPRPSWIAYRTQLQFHGPFGASVPKSKEELEQFFAFLGRDGDSILVPTGEGLAAPTAAEDVAESLVRSQDPPETRLDAVPAEIREELGDEAASKAGYATILKDEHGLYYEGRCIRAHLKDCAQVVAGSVPELAGFRAKFTDRIYIVGDDRDKVYLRHPDGSIMKEVAGTVQRFVHVITPRGPRSSIKLVDYVEAPAMRFDIRCWNDDIITQRHLALVLHYGGLHGMGQDRSFQWGRYEVVKPQVLILEGEEADCLVVE